ncbi:MAG: gliding motility lipoprotein GldJ [Sphingobacteriaceae bacterium]|nr:MAG: gliding motility lipoprotein GldJ [Sphingobacteriaceae bacterium]
MRKNFIGCALTVCVLGGILSSCNKAKSPKTGWAYNDRTNGGFQVFAKKHPAPGPGLVPIEGGTFVLGGSLNEDLQFDYNNIRRRVTVASFYMDETEVANTDWLEYLYWIKRTYPQEREMYYNAIPDTLVWRQPLSYNEPYVDNYLRHPGYQDYPVVGVTWDQANDYCDWRTQRVNEEILRERGIITDWKTMSKSGKTGSSAAFNTDIYLNGQYRGKGIDGKRMPKDLNPAIKPTGGKAPTRPARIEDGVLKQPYRLPSEAEWEYAALALAGNTQYENISDGKVYPWNGMGVRSPKKSTRGLILANFKRGAGDNMGTGGSLNDKADVTAPVRAYPPNDFGLYNMAGNVNEWTGDTYRQLSYEDFEDFNPFRGNIYTNKRLANTDKGLLAKDKYGRPIKDLAKTSKKQKWSELNGSQATAAETNAANANPSSSAVTAANNSGKAFTPDVRGFADSVNTTLYGNTTLVNDHSKVYKGGSWNDRAYWLNPATRRFMDEEEATAETGFRCAMGMIGAAEINPANKPHFRVKKAKSPKKIQL